MRIIGQMVVGPGEGDRWLGKCLSEIKKRCDEICVCLNNADEKTKKIVGRNTQFAYEDNREWGKYQPKIKEQLLKCVGLRKPNWILALDADEFLEDRLDRKKLEELARKPNDVAYFFWFLDFWNQEGFYREEYLFEDVRFFKFLPDHPNYRNTPVHCGMAPEFNMRWGTHSEYYVKHYGLMKKEDRARKYQRYEKYDPKASYLAKWWYEGLKQDNVPLKEEKDFLDQKLQTYFRKRSVMQKQIAAPSGGRKIWQFLNKHGVLFSVEKEKHALEYMKNRNYTLVEEQVIPESEVDGPMINNNKLWDLAKDLPIVDEEKPVQTVKPPKEINEPVPDSNKCPECSFVGKSFKSLQIHRTKSHK